MVVVPFLLRSMSPLENSSLDPAFFRQIPLPDKLNEGELLVRMEATSSVPGQNKEEH